MSLERLAVGVKEYTKGPRMSLSQVKKREVRVSVVIDFCEANIGFFPRKSNSGIEKRITGRRFCVGAGCRFFF